LLPRLCWVAPLISAVSNMECLQVRDCRRARGAGCHGAPLLALKYL
jgi:hypothetical protein